MSEETKKSVYRMEEVRQHTNGRSAWIVVHNKVYDVTTFLEEHPGGEEVLLEQAGGDASESFEDVGHSSDARELMADYYVGDLAEEDRVGPPPKETTTKVVDSKTSNSNLPVLVMTITVAVVLIAVLAFKFAS